MQGEAERQRALDRLEADIGACRACRDGLVAGAPPIRTLPHEPRPVCVPSATARIVVCGQAPGTRVHASGVPFTDPSGDRLRQWLDVDSATFYDPKRMAIVPMGFCFPGLDAKGSDLAPRRECRELWHDRLFTAMPQVELVLAIGRYAQDYHLPPAWRKASLTEIVAAWRDIVAETAAAGRTVFPLPHPSWRNSGWIKRHPWFEAELLPALRVAVAGRLAPAGAHAIAAAPNAC